MMDPKKDEFANIPEGFGYNDLPKLAGKWISATIDGVKKSGKVIRYHQTRNSGTTILYLRPDGNPNVEFDIWIHRGRSETLKDIIQMTYSDYVFWKLQNTGNYLK